MIFLNQSVRPLDGSTEYFGIFSGIPAAVFLFFKKSVLWIFGKDGLMKFNNLEPVSINVDLVEIGEKIRMFREKRGLTQNDLACKMNGRCDARTISKYERGEEEMKFTRFFYICSALEVMPNELLPEDVLFVMEKYSNSYSEYGHLDEIHKPIADYIIDSLYFKQNHGLKGTR